MKKTGSQGETLSEARFQEAALINFLSRSVPEKGLLEISGDFWCYLVASLVSV